MSTKSSRFGFAECADLISEQKYGPALKTFQSAVSRFLESKITPRRSEIARQFLISARRWKRRSRRPLARNGKSTFPDFQMRRRSLLARFVAKRNMMSGPSSPDCLSIYAMNVSASATRFSPTKTSRNRKRLGSRPTIQAPNGYAVFAWSLVNAMS